VRGASLGSTVSCDDDLVGMLSPEFICDQLSTVPATRGARQVMPRSRIGKPRAAMRHRACWLPARLFSSRRSRQIE